MSSEGNSEEKRENLEITANFGEYLDRIRGDKTRAEVVEEIVESGMPMYVLSETPSEGQATLKWIESLNILGPSTVEKKSPQTTREIEQYRQLADKFGPVTAGIKWLEAFAIKSGFQTTIEDPEDDTMKRNKDEIDKLNDNIYQDRYTRGLDTLTSILQHESFIVGFSAAEIVYEEEMKFLDYVEDTTKIENPITGETTYDYTIAEDRDWQRHKGIQRLKFIDDAVLRLTEVRDAKSFEVKYWILDKGEDSETFLLPEQVFILPNDAEGTNLKGKSEVMPVAVVAVLLDEIMKAIGVNYKRWGNKRFFFIMGHHDRPWSPAHQANFMKDTAQMVKKNKLGVTVPAGFDYKEIGGEIFEGRDIIDTMLGIIASGMQYPKEFQESPRTQASDKSWLAWLVKVDGVQRDTRRAIEHQLWEPHLWCRFGKTYRVKKQGVKVEEQEQRTQYVPKLSWNTKGRWHIREKIDMLRSLLNVSNPVTPHFKLALEKDMAQTLGYDDIKFPTPEELEQMLKAEEAKTKEKEPVGTSVENVPTGTQKKPPPPVGGTRVPKELKKKRY